MKTIIKCIFLSVLLSLVAMAYADSAHSENEMVKLSLQNMSLANIKTSILEKKPITRYIIVPGEIVPNRDETAIIAPRIQAQVVKRLVNVGDYVKKGQPLVALSSVAVAAAQSQLLIDAKEWERYKQLGTKIVTKKSYEEAEIKFRQAYAKLLAYGLTNNQIQDFISSQQANKADGEFTLLAPISGTVAEAKIVLGQMLDPGTEIYEITNENNLWVNALLSAENQYSIQLGNEAIVKTNNKSVMGKVIQVHHQLDKKTRTQIVRIAIDNQKDLFHPGEFVTCQIAVGKTEPVLAVPNKAIIRAADGDKLVFVETKPGNFLAKEVNIEFLQGQNAIVTGLEPGDKVVINGAFFIFSEMKKAGFSAHNH